MDIGDWFWIGMAFWLFGGVGWFWRPEGRWGPVFGGNLLLFFLIFALGVAEFGWPIK